MGTDRARRSYDETRKYRSVVHQQGRVVLEADLNEAQEILTEEARKEALDFVGPVGTPDDGYRVSFPGAGHDFNVGAGTLYVGGLRVFQKDAIKYSAQPDWIDAPKKFKLSAHELIYLALQDQEISAVEDPALREVALGGPDTAQRTRLIQHVMREGVTSKTSSAAFAELVAEWSNLGQSFDPKSQRLFSTARLLVSVVTSDENISACKPAGQEGYLGAENQLVRVQISAASKLLWAYDNAASIYPVNVTTTGAGTTIELLTPPVDAYHDPRKGQRIELLRSAAKLESGRFAAALSGHVAPTAITAGAYDPDKRTLQLTDIAPPEYTTAGAAGTPLYARVWEDEIAFTPGTATVLTGTRLGVTLTGTKLVIGDHWIFAARPSTPKVVYPEDYLTKAQPPSGPRRWVAALSFVRWSDNVAALEDLRPPFDNLVELTKRKGGGCCTVTLTPQDLTGGKTLQSIIDQRKETTFEGERLTICLMPGLYELAEPLRLDHGHSFLTIEGCHDGAVIQAAKGAEAKFLDGLVVLTHADNVTFRRLRFHLPLVNFAKAKGSLAGLSNEILHHLEAPPPAELFASVGLRPMHCAELTVHDCLFRFAVAREEKLFGAGVFAGSECWGLDLQHNRFLHKDNYLRHGSFRMTFGYLLAPSTTAKIAGDDRISSGTVVRSLLTDAVIRENVFSGLTAAALVYADLGVVKIEENAVRECFSGFSLFALRAPLFDEDQSYLHAGKREDLGPYFEDARAVLPTFLQQPLVRGGFSIARAYPAPADLPARHVRPVLKIGTSKGTLNEVLGAVEERRFRDDESDLPILHTALHVADNDVRAMVPAGPSSTALTVFLSERDPRCSLILSANRMSTDGGGPVAVVLLARRCAITGNMLFDEANGVSLVVVTRPNDQGLSGMAVTGNVFLGQAVLPPRVGAGGSTPLPPWDELNSTIV